jgi:hypothetical protein
LRSSISAPTADLEGVGVELRRGHLDGDDLVDAGEFRIEVKLRGSPKDRDGDLSASAAHRSGRR